MAVDYVDVISPGGIEAAARLACSLAAAQPATPLDEQVERAVRQTFCACVVEIEDLIEGGLSGAHAALLEEVGRRARQALGAA